MQTDSNKVLDLGFIKIIYGMAYYFLSFLVDFKKYQMEIKLSFINNCSGNRGSRLEITEQYG